MGIFDWLGPGPHEDDFDDTGPSPFAAGIQAYKEFKEAEAHELANRQERRNKDEEWNYYNNDWGRYKKLKNLGSYEGSTWVQNQSIERKDAFEYLHKFVKDRKWWHEDTIGVPKMSTDMVVYNNAKVAIPKFLKGHAGLATAYNQKRFKKQSKFQKRVKFMISQALQKNFPLRIRYRGPLDASTGDLSSVFGAKIDLANSTAGEGGDVLITGLKYFWEAASWGTSTPPAATDGVLAIYGPTPNARFSWNQFIDLTSTPDEFWVELKYEKCMTAIFVPATIDNVYCCSYYLLMPLLNVQSGTTPGEASGASVAAEVAKQFGKGFFLDTIPNRNNPEKGEMMVLWKTMFKFNKGANSISELTASTAPTTAVQYLVPVTQRSFKRKHQFKYGRSGLRFYCCNHVNEWIPAATAGVKYFFLGADRTTPLIPVRINKWWTACPTGSNLVAASQNNLVGNWLTPSMFTATYTWYRIEVAGQFTAPAAEIVGNDAPPP